MTWQLTKILLSGSLIAFTSWLAEKQPRLAGFVLALPLTSMLALAFFNAEYRDSEKAVLFAKSVVTAVPLSLLFFVPFFFAGKFQSNFWVLYAAGILLLAIGYVIHRTILAG